MTLPEAFVAPAPISSASGTSWPIPETLDAYATDFWRLIEGRPALVLRPGSTEEVARHRPPRRRSTGVPIVPQGGNTGLVGGGDAGRERHAGGPQPRRG